MSDSLKKISASMLSDGAVEPKRPGFFICKSQKHGTNDLHIRNYHNGLPYAVPHVESRKLEQPRQVV